MQSPVRDAAEYSTTAAPATPPPTPRKMWSRSSVVQDAALTANEVLASAAERSEAVRREEQPVGAVPIDEARE